MINGGDRLMAVGTISKASVISSVLDFVANPLGGAISDRFGRKLTLILSTILSGIGWLSVGLSPSNATNILGRVLSQTFLSPQGSCYMVAQNAALSDVLDGEEPLAVASAQIRSMMGIGMVLGPVVAGVLSSRDATLRLTFCAAGLLQFANALYVALAVKETHSGAASDGGWGALLRGANPLSFVRLFCHGRRLSTVTLAIGLSAFSDQEKDLKSIYRREVLQWTPAASATYLSAQGLTYFLGPQLTRPMLKALGPRRTTMYGQIAAAAEHGIRAGLIGAPGPRSTVLMYGNLLTAIPGNVNLRLASARAEQTMEGIRVGMARGELAAAAQNFEGVLRLLAPLAYHRTYMRLQHPERMWFVNTALVLASQFIFTVAVGADVDAAADDA